jgi:hypothetical protein
MVALQLFLTYWAPMNRLFGTAPIDAVTWFAVVAVAAVTWTIVEVEKGIRRSSIRRGQRSRRAMEPIRPAP